jgi:hypothetical protein
VLPRLNQADLEAYLDEALPAEEMAAVEDQLRASPQLTEELTRIGNRRDTGIHTLGEIWRRHRVSCPSREHLGGFLLGILETDQADSIRFHLEVIRCRLCQANLDDLRLQQEASATAADRCRRYFASSAGYLKR